MKLLEKKRENRYPTARAVREALLPFRSPAPLSTDAASTRSDVSPASGTAGRRTLRIALGVLAAGAAGAVLLALLGVFGRG